MAYSIINVMEELIMFDKVASYYLFRKKKKIEI